MSKKSKPGDGTHGRGKKGGGGINDDFPSGAGAYVAGFFSRLRAMISHRA